MKSSQHIVFRVVKDGKLPSVISMIEAMSNSRSGIDTKFIKVTEGNLTERGIVPEEVKPVIDTMSPVVRGQLLDALENAKLPSILVVGVKPVENFGTEFTHICGFVRELNIVSENKVFWYSYVPEEK